MINKGNIEKMLEMPDDKLCMMLRVVLSGMGVDISDKKIDEKSVRKIRALLEEITDEDIERITFLVNRYKHGD